jgi:hypothetical protein
LRVAPLAEKEMVFAKVIAAVAVSAAFLAVAPGHAQAPAATDFGTAKRDADSYELGVRIATLLQKFDDPASFTPQSARGFRSYRGSGTSYFYANARYACRVDIGYSYVFPDYHGQTTEAVECCTTESPFVCDRYPDQGRVPGADQ